MATRSVRPNEEFDNRRAAAKIIRRFAKPYEQMEEKVWAFIKEKNLIKEGLTVGVATSGGPDSMALLVCLRKILSKNSSSICCVHFEHGIRGQESLNDADFVMEYCEKEGIPFYMGAADVPALARKWGLSKQTAAKQAREDYFSSLIKNGEINIIATAHHQSDNAESILMHILRGSGTNGLYGIHEKRGDTIRPFLCVGKNEITQYIEKNDIPFVTDSSNSDNRYSRNYIRNELIPLLEQHINSDVASALLRLSSLAATDADYLDECAKAAYKNCAATLPEQVEIDLERFCSLHKAIASRVVRLACGELYLVQDIEQTHVEAVLALAKTKKTGSKANLANNLFAEVEYDKLLIGFSARERDYSFCMSLDMEGETELPNGDIIVCATEESYEFDAADSYSEYFDKDRLPGSLTVRTRHAGDVITPLGSGSKKLKDYFIDKKLPRKTRDRVPLIAADKDILWIVGHIINDQYRVTEGTTNYLKMRYIKNQEDF